MDNFMKEAIDCSRDNIYNNHGGPFGACVVKDGKIIGKGSNMVLINNDPTAHAEVVAIRDACKNIGSHDLTGCTLYTSCYPCPMCLSAIIWSNIKDVYYANTSEDAEKIGFRDKMIYDYLKSNMDENLLSFKQIDRDEAIKVFEEFREKDNRIIY
ncbi:MAG: nucleoside deaminase [Bacilli bacterium]|nr:nucleoside deaminase [Bacilli bacterium]